ncbi:hypothetical protein DFH28DRAFT_905459 [Melampsora americana]|nr:hypothetical protein DFH28DRAFT_905459 [Melampsora americana]
MSSNHRTTLELSQISPFDSGNEEDLMRLEDFQNIEDHQEFDLGDVDHLQDHQSRSENEVAEEEEEEEEEDFIKDYSNELNSSSIFNFDHLNSSSSTGGSCSSSINHEIINLGSIEEVVEEDPVLFSTPYQPFWRRWESMFRTLSSGSR